MSGIGCEELSGQRKGTAALNGAGAAVRLLSFAYAAAVFYYIDVGAEVTFLRDVTLHEYADLFRCNVLFRALRHKTKSFTNARYVRVHGK